MSPIDNPEASLESAAPARYYAEGAVWSDETLGELRRSRTSAWRLAAAAMLIMVLNAVALLGLSPLARSVPYSVEVERQTGAALAVQALLPGPLKDNVAYTQSMAARYVTAREGFASWRILGQYRLVELLSAPMVRKAYSASLQRTNGPSPLTLYPAGAILDVGIISISLIDAGHMLVRYSTVRSDLTGAQPQQAQAQIGFTYVDLPMRDLDRYDDPLGFQVTSYSTQPL